MSKGKPTNFWLRLYKWYGKYILVFESIIILISSLITFFLVYFAIVRTMYPIVIAMAATFWVHNQITKQIVENEFHAIKIFRHYKISLDFLKIGIVGTIATVVAIPLVGLFSLLDVFSPIFDVLLISFAFFVSLVLMTSFFQLTLPRLKAHKKARLCFRITKHTLEEAIGKDEEQRQQIVIKCMHASSV